VLEPWVLEHELHDLERVGEPRVNAPAPEVRWSRRPDQAKSSGVRAIR
jgi:hypothetical protein